uniref:Uncharacterized protein n=1 Tax=Rhizophora mucronata TaxID=61149 RepID=A0A2P2QYM6_RHIMU
MCFDGLFPICIHLPVVRRILMSIFFLLDCIVICFSFHESLHDNWVQRFVLYAMIGSLKSEEQREIRLCGCLFSSL